MYTKRKVERKGKMPPSWCQGICTNSMNDVCVEVCAKRRDACWFEPKKDYTLSELPPFSFKTWQNDLTPKERQTYIGFYMEKVVDKLQGREQTVWTRATRPDKEEKPGKNGKIIPIQEILKTIVEEVEE